MHAVRHLQPVIRNTRACMLNKMHVHKYTYILYIHCTVLTLKVCKAPLITVQVIERPSLHDIRGIVDTSIYCYMQCPPIIGLHGSQMTALAPL